MAYSTGACRWSAKQYILLALAGTLVVTLVVIVVSVVLSPAEIHFSITDASTINSSKAGGMELNLTLTANNTSHRAGVNYRRVTVSLLHISSDNGKASFPVDNVSLPSWQSPWSTASIGASAFFPSEMLESDFAGKPHNATRISVQLDTDVRFKYGRVYTRLYNIRVLCDPGHYFSWRPPILQINCSDG